MTIEIIYNLSITYIDKNIIFMQLKISKIFIIYKIVKNYLNNNSE